jgi:hypothetical protein
MPLDRRAFIRFVAGWLAFPSIVSRLDAKDDLLTVPIRREPIESKSITSVGYHAELRVLEIEFRRGAIYRFFSVPSSVFEGLQRAESKGRYFSQSIRGKFEFQHLAEVKP